MHKKSNNYSKTKLELKYGKYLILVKTKSCHWTLFVVKVCKFCIAFEYNFGLLYKNGNWNTAGPCYICLDFTDSY